MAEKILTNWPRHSGEFKVVQMEVDGHPFIIFGPDSEFHTALIREFLQRFPDREVATVRDEFDNEYPALEGDWYKVWGTGKALANKEKRELIFYGHSKAYNLGISAEHLERIRAMKPAWKIHFRE
ncbi:MAG TPA: hypothetical protein VJ485_01410 [archaeon]|nr:hypothetical protein [archaeon]